MGVSKWIRVATIGFSMLLLGATVGLADTVQVDGDIVDANKDILVAECGALPFDVDVKWSPGFAHWTVGGTVTVTAQLSAAALAAGLVVEGGGDVVVPSPWQSGSLVSVPFTIGAPSGTAGTYTLVITGSGPSVQDPDGTFVVSRTVDVIVNVAGLGSGAFLPPVEPGPPTSVFKYKSTIPVKIQFTTCDGRETPDGLTVTINVVRISGSTPPNGEDEASSTSAADTGNLMRFAGSHYIYNLATKPLSDPTATYRITVTVVETGQSFTTTFGLRN